MQRCGFVSLAFQPFAQIVSDKLNPLTTLLDHHIPAYTSYPQTPHLLVLSRNTFDYLRRLGAAIPQASNMPPDLNSVPPSPKVQTRAPLSLRASTASSRRTSSTMPPPSGSAFVSPVVPHASMATGEERMATAGPGMIAIQHSLLDRS